MESPIVQSFESFLLEHLPKAKSFHPHYEEALGYTLKCGGKRFRPFLMLTLVDFYQPLLLQNALYPALAVEMFHTYSLIHDDLPSMDNSPLRRGFETLHTKYDEVTAILVGDALNTHAFYLLCIAPFSDETRVKLVKSLSYNGGAEGMVLGQALDCSFENKRLGFEQLRMLHLNKTAKLIAASLQMGAIISNLDAKSVQEWYEFGLDLGVLFQIQDDIIDATSDEQTQGKPTGNDGIKNTYVNILGLDGAKEEKSKLQESLNARIEHFKKPLKGQFEQIMTKYF